MNKNYLLILFVMLFFQIAKAQNCPTSIGTQSSVTEPHFKIMPGTCNDYPTNITIDGSNFIKSECNGTNLYYELILPDSELDNDDTFIADFGFGICQFVSGELQTLTIDEFNIEESISIYPNPLDKEKELNIQFPKQITGHIELYDSTGKIIYRDKVVNLKEKVVAFPNIKGGMFFLRVYTQKNIFVQKIIIR